MYFRQIMKRLCIAFDSNYIITEIFKLHSIKFNSVLISSKEILHHMEGAKIII